MREGGLVPTFQEAIAQHSAGQRVVENFPGEDPLGLISLTIFALRDSPERTMLTFSPVLFVHKLLLLLLVPVLEEILNHELLKR